MTGRNTMRAAVVTEFGGPDAVRVIETAVPEPRAGQVRIAVRAAAVNPVDLATAAGVMHEVGNAPARPRIGLGWDVAGVIDAAGPDTGFAPGDAVVAIADRVGAPLAAFADYVVVPAYATAPAPRTVGFEEAATLPLPGLTALQALDALRLSAGSTLLVTGAAGGVGGIAAALAVARGVEVVGSASEGDGDRLRALGVRHVIDRGDDLGEAVRARYPLGVDAAIDAAVTGVAALDAVRNRGALATVIGTAPRLRGIDVHPILVRADQTGLRGLVAAVDAGTLPLTVAGTYPLAETGAALAAFAEGGVRGRIVIVP